MRATGGRRLAGAVLTAAVVAFASAGLVVTAHADPNVSTDGNSADGRTTDGAATNSQPRFLGLTIDSIAPTTVTLNSDAILSVTATVTNIGDRTVEDISARIQRGPAVGSTSELRSALRLEEQNFTIAGPFVTEVDRLTPGQHKQFHLTIRLRSDPDLPKPAPSLQIAKPGVYPLLVNVNGKPAYGKQARLDDARFLLPVLGLPPDANAANPQSPAAKAVMPAPAPPVATTLLWPLADRPRRVAGQPGSVGDKIELTDDDLAKSVAKGGRLDQLVGALEFATGRNADRDHKLADSVCLAVDPDLLGTVAAMTKGYVVPETPGDFTGSTKDGEGADAATDWLTRVRALAANLCTVALPYAQTDLSAVAASDNKALSAAAITEPADLVDTLLSTKSIRGVSWPASGSIDDAAGAVLRKSGISTVLLGADAVRQDTPVARKAANAKNAAPLLPAPDVVRLPGIVAPVSSGDAATNPPTDTKTTDTTAADTKATTDTKTATDTDPALHAATFDVSTAAALAAVGDRPQTPSVVPARLRYDLKKDSRQARLQDALGALTWTAIDPAPGAPRSQLIAPPQRWEPSNAEANALLGQLTTLLRSGLAVPRHFTGLLGQAPDPVPFRLDYLSQAATDGAPQSLRGPIRTVAGTIDELAGALIDDPLKELSSADFLGPLRQDLLRSASMSGKQAAGRDAVERTATAIDALFHDVTVLSPSGVYTLASKQSPLPLVARNGLPLGIRVLITVDAPADVKITNIGEVQLPANGTRPLQLPTEVSATRHLDVHFSLITPQGRVLGEPTSVSVRSNAYGNALAVATGCAGALLLLLAGRRLWRRFRGQPDPADVGLDVTTRRRVNRYGRAKRRASNDAHTDGI